LPRTKFGGDEGKIRDFVARLYKNVPVLDSGARGSTTTFAQRGIGDVLIAWETRPFLLVDELGKDKFEIVAPTLSILASRRWPWWRRTPASTHCALARAYLEFLYTEEGQRIIAKNHYRPRDVKVAPKHAAHFPKLRLLTVDGDFGGWQKSKRPTSRTTALSTRSTPVESSWRLRHTSLRARAGGPGRCPAFRPTLGFTLLYLSLVVVATARALILKSAG